VRKKWLPFF